MPTLYTLPVDGKLVPGIAMTSWLDESGTSKQGITFKERGMDLEDRSLYIPCSDISKPEIIQGKVFFADVSGWELVSMPERDADRDVLLLIEHGYIQTHPSAYRTIRAVSRSSWGFKYLIRCDRSLRLFIELPQNAKQKVRFP